VTFGVRIVDTLMLTGVVDWSDVYTEPSGPTFTSNLISEITFGNTFTVAALTGSTMLICQKEQ